MRAIRVSWTEEYRFSESEIEVPDDLDIADKNALWRWLVSQDSDSGRELIGGDIRSVRELK